MHSIVLIGPPCSGKTTYKNKYLSKYTSISCDDIREELYGSNYKWSPVKEKKVWKLYDSLIDLSSFSNDTVVIDNTNCKGHYLQQIEAASKTIEFVIFRKSLLTLLWRNHWRNLRTGKWIPWSVIFRMRRNFKELLASDEFIKLLREYKVTWA